MKLYSDNLKKLLELSKIRRVDYNALRNHTINHLFNQDEYFDINVIIPIRGRIHFLKPLYNSFIKALSKTKLKVTFTVVEQSTICKHEKYCIDNKINFIWISSVKDEPFNKCMAMNTGAIENNKSNFFIFHDVDCLVQSDFFLKLEENIKLKSANAIQCFTKRRVLYLDLNLTNSAIFGSLDIDKLDSKSSGVSLPNYLGAPGGSICIKRELFFGVGGYDSELFSANAPEDIFFWNKVDTIGKMHICDNPEIEIFHMNHAVTYNDNPLVKEMLNTHKMYEGLTLEEKKIFISEQSVKLSKYVNG